MTESTAQLKSNTDGLALLCDGDGLVSQVLHSAGDIDASGVEGVSFLSLVSAGDLQKAESFFDTLRRRHAAFNCELELRGPIARGRPMTFGGGAAGDTFIIVGTRSRSEAARYYNDLMRINNEQTNSLRSALKELSQRADEESLIGDRLYDDLSRLNNELATMQRELAKKNHELARLNEQKNQFLGIASHDLRNPLEVILNYSQFLLEDTADVLADEHKEFINIIRSSSGFMLNLVNDFLDYSKIEAGKLDLER
ncbi:MAG TPA: histidine kinase dimerization/phospho-acceptor domain-containing protein, partial [Pyrinomonadaceae bacterium]|nr:histidine kinase dimerization/phospho-acceptor domain-containing protein [Pyrinomonadaceae bacterium]